MKNVEKEVKEKWDFKDEDSLRTAYAVLVAQTLGIFQTMFAESRHMGSGGYAIMPAFVLEELPKQIEEINERYCENAQRLGLPMDPPVSVESAEIKDFLNEIREYSKK